MDINAEKRTIEVNNSKIESGELFDQTKELVIHHKNEVYRLRLTGNDKLILTK